MEQMCKAMQIKAGQRTCRLKENKVKQSNAEKPRTTNKFDLIVPVTRKTVSLAACESCARIVSHLWLPGLTTDQNGKLHKSHRDPG